MIEVMTHYLLFLIAFQPFEEYYNCLHPSPNSELVHFVCNWDEEGLSSIGKKTVIRLEEFVKTIDKGEIEHE